MEQKALAVTSGGIVPATQYRNKQGYMPPTVEYRSRGTEVRKIEHGSKEHTQFLNVIDELPTYMGVREPLTEQQVIVCTQFISEYFGHLNAFEIVRAFTMAAAGKLTAPIEISQENASATQINAANDGQLVTVTAETFNKWSLPYVGKILKAYSDMRQRETLEWSKATEADRMKIEAGEQIVLTPCEVLDAIIEFIEETKEVPLSCRWDLAYIELETRGEIAMTNEDKADYMEKIRESEMSQYDSRTNREKRQALIDLEKGDVLKSKCRKALVITWALSKYHESKYLLPMTLPKVKLKP